jgi:multidrug efflux pump subunit AcrB
MIVSLTVVPFFASRVLKTNHNPEGNIFLRVLQRIIKGSYGRVLDVALNKPVTTLLIAAVVFAGSMLIFPVIGFKLFPTSEKPQFLVNINMPLQSNIETTNEMTRQVEAELSKRKIMYYTSNTGKGNPAFITTKYRATKNRDFAQIFVQLENDIKPDEKRDMIEDLRNRFPGFFRCQY